MRVLKVLIGCEFSGVVRDAFIKKGHDAMSCDLLPTERKGSHYQGDIRDILSDRSMVWDLFIAHPECTYMCNSGVRWLHTDPKRWPKLFQAASFFNELKDANMEKVALENPIMHKYAKTLIGVNQSQVIQPWQYGHGETKATCLWLKNLPLLLPTNIVDGREARIHKMSRSADRGKKRSVTYQGIADAMAEQWGSE